MGGKETLKPLKPQDVRPKGTEQEINDNLWVSKVLYNIYYSSGLAPIGENKHDALVMKAKGLILQNPCPEDLKRVKRS